VVIPQALREALNTSANFQLSFSLDGNRIMIEKRDPEQILGELLAVTR
jgi:bifunctional DNA-binding transcriptional regulator/antitoxin component of YhaV-PrlF toxin-antitoxin module